MRQKEVEEVPDVLGCNGAKGFRTLVPDHVVLGIVPQTFNQLFNRIFALNLTQNVGNFVSEESVRTF